MVLRDTEYGSADVCAVCVSVRVPAPPPHQEHVHGPGRLCPKTLPSRGQGPAPSAEGISRFAQELFSGNVIIAALTAFF